MYPFHTPGRSLRRALCIWCLFLVSVPLFTSPSIPVFGGWQNAPLPSGHPTRVYCLLNGTYCGMALDMLAETVNQLLSPAHE